MKKILLLLVTVMSFGCGTEHRPDNAKYRQPVDTVGFAHEAWQMDSVMARITRLEADQLEKASRMQGEIEGPWKAAICPHDDYAYAGYLYPALLENVKASTIILFGVAHKARLLGLEDRLIFDSFDYWDEPYGPVKVSPLREGVMNELDDSLYMVSDTMQAMEHSLEAIIPFLQYYNRNIEVVPILVPYMSYERMEMIAAPLADAISDVLRRHNLTWGKDLALVISNDAVHYGDEDWGGNNYAPYGSDTSGYQEATGHDRQIIRECLTGKLSPEKVHRFTEYTVMEKDHREYKWTWCGRYALPLGLLTSYYLQGETVSSVLSGYLVGYETSISQATLPVNDLGMGVTAPAYIRHWVGYAAIGYR